MKKTIALILTLASLLLITLTGCGGGGDTIKIAAKPGTEQNIIAEMLGLIVEDATGKKVEITKDLSGTEIIQPAMEKGEFDLYAEYTSTAWIFVVEQEDFPDDATMLAELERFYAEEKNMRWLGLYGFNNTFTLTVPTALASQHGLETYSDLAAIADTLVFGGNFDFIENASGLQGVCAAYDMEFKEVRDIAIGLNCPALAQGDIQVTNAFTTDPQLSVADVKTLTDDQQYFTNFFCGTVVRQQVLDDNPGLEEALQSLNGQISDAEMCTMNYAVEVDGQNEKEVARAFLTEKGILKG